MARNTAISAQGTHDESPIGTWNGFVVLFVGLALVGVAAWQLWSTITGGRPFSPWSFVAAGTLFVFAMLILAGLYTLQPNEAAILQLFGAYRGTTRVPGLRATNPFYTRRKLSLRARNLNGERLKVNDKRGNPIEIAAVVVWHVEDTAKAAFDVDDYENFVKVQSEAAVRHLASNFAYDDDETSATSASRRCWAAPTSSRRRWCASCRHGSTRPASSSRRRGSPISPTPRRSRR